MDDALDTLIATALGSDDAAASPETTETPDEASLATEPEQAAPENPEEAAPETATEPAAEDAASPEEPPHEAQPDGTEQPAVAQETAPTPAPDLAALQAQLEQQRQLNAAWQQQFALQQQQAQWAQLKAQWDEMAPDDAYQAQLAFYHQQAQAEIARRDQVIQQIQQEQARQAFLQQEAAAKPKVIDHLVKQHGLTDADRRYLERFSNPDAMIVYAESVKEQRRAQTEAARASRAEQVKQNAGAFAQTGHAGSPAPQPAKTYQLGDLDQLIADALSA